MDLLAAAEYWANETPDRPVQESAGKSLSYRELVSGANGVASEIGRLDLEPGVPILVKAHKEPEALVGFLGVLLAGHPYVPVDSGLPLARVAVIEESARAPLVLTPESVARFAARGGSPSARVRPDESVQYVMFTSGSTGRPKGVPITRRNLDQFQRWLLSEQQLGNGDERILDQAVYSFDLSVMSVYPTIAKGGTLVSITRDDLADLGRLFRVLAGSGLTTWVSTPMRVPGRW